MLPEPVDRRDAARFDAWAQGLLGPAAALTGGALRALFSRKQVVRRQVLVRQGETWSQAIWVERGLLRMYFVRPDGRELNKNFHREGAFLFPVTGRMADSPSLFELAALEDCILHVAPWDALAQLLARAGCLQALQQATLERLLTDKLQREHDLLVLGGRSRYEKLLRQEPELLDRVPLVHLASYLGLTDVSLSRLRRNHPTV